MREAQALAARVVLEAQDRRSATAGPSNIEKAKELAEARAGKRPAEDTQGDDGSTKKKKKKADGPISITFKVVGYIDSRKPFVQFSRVIDLRDINRPTYDFWKEYIHTRVVIWIENHPDQFEGTDTPRPASSWLVNFGPKKEPESRKSLLKAGTTLRRF
jgi:hypothetical protein